jgi:AraC family transcriptional regulator
MRPPFLHARSLFASATVRLELVTCTSPTASWSAEEQRTEHTLSFPWSGLNVRALAGTEEVASASRVLFLNAGDVYRVKHPVGSGETTLNVAVAADALVDILRRADASAVERTHRPFTAAAAPCPPRLHLELRRLAHQLGAGAVDALEAEERGLALVARAVLEPAAPAPGPTPEVAPARAHAALAQRAHLELWRRRFDPALSLRALARALGVSPFYLSRTFRRVLGRPLFAERNALRLAAALDRLAAPEIELAPLAVELGFSSHSHFAAAFRAHFGQTPSAARGRLRAHPRRALAELREVEQRLDSAARRRNA